MAHILLQVECFITNYQTQHNIKRDIWYHKISCQLSISSAVTVSTDKNSVQLETKAMPPMRNCNTGRTCLPLPIITRENTSLAIQVQKITIIRAQKFGKFSLKFDTLYWRHLAAQKKFEYRCTTTNHPV